MGSVDQLWNSKVEVAGFLNRFESRLTFKTQGIILNRMFLKGNKTLNIIASLTRLFIKIQYNMTHLFAVGKF